MMRLSVALCLVITVGMGSGALRKQLVDVDDLKKELDLLKRENALLKKEIESLKKGSAATPAEKDADSPLSATVDNVEYVYQGMVRNGAIVMVTLLATSKKGDKVGLHGAMTLIDEDGDKYKSESGNARPQLREGVPVKIVWRFGPNSLGKSSAPSPKITRFASLSVAPTRASEVSSLEFRNVPAELAKPKGK